MAEKKKPWQQGQGRRKGNLDLFGGTFGPGRKTYQGDPKSLRRNPPSKMDEHNAALAKFAEAKKKKPVSGSEEESEQRFRAWEKEWEAAKPSPDLVATALEQEFGYGPGAAKEHAQIYLDEAWESATEQGRYVGGPSTEDMDPDTIAKRIMKDSLGVKNPEQQRVSPLVPVGMTDFRKSMTAKKAKRASEQPKTPAEVVGAKAPVLKPHPDKAAAMKKFQQSAGKSLREVKAGRGLKRGKKGGMYYETKSGRKVYVK